MNECVLRSVPEIVSKPGLLSDLPTFLQNTEEDGPVLVVLDPGLRAPGIIVRVESILRDAGIAALISVPPAGEPKESYIRETVEEARHQSPRAVVCIGGGSVMDAGKLIACLLTADEDVATYRLASAPLPDRQLPLLCAPTTSGTGSEVTSIAIASDEQGIKYWYWSSSMRPDRVLLDPELTVGLPPMVTAETGMDALVHALEAATNNKAAGPNQIYSHYAIDCVRRYLPIAAREPANLVARSKMQEAAVFAGIAIENAGTCLAHAVGHALGSLAGIPHGRAVTIGLCATLAWSMEGHEEEFADAAKAMGLDDVTDLPVAIRDFAQKVGIDLDLGPVGDRLTEEQLAEQFLKPENINMVRASRREVTAADCLTFAERTLNLGRAVAAAA